ncbi:MAG: ceramidase domain-containing protein [Planctomycetes bacterium]|nr:ceramidase domain-containing protein [Planctomycetota bacterium]
MDGSARISAWKLGVFLLVLAAGAGLILSQGAIPQNPAFHDFADQRACLGVPHFLNSVSNLPFLWVGAAGLLFLFGPDWPPSFQKPRERHAFIVLFTGVFLTGIGSTYYHLHPTTERLFWDRLPLTLVFGSFFVAVCADRLGPRAGSGLFLPVIFLSAASVVYWYWGERNGSGDLRPYAVVQFCPMAAIPVLLLLFASRYTCRSHALWVIGIYALAKVAEEMDRPVYALGHAVSGHTLKHLLAAWATAWILKMVRERRPVSAGTSKSPLVPA